MRFVLKVLPWFLLVLLGASAQQGPTNKASMAGLNLTLQGCRLSGDILTCTVEVSNPHTKPMSTTIAPNTVLALTTSGWLYQGQVSAGTVRLNPGGKTTLNLTFRGVNNPTGLFAMIQVGDARFLGVMTPGATKLMASDGYCIYWGPYDGMVCHVTIANDTDADLNLRVFPNQSFVITDLGARYLGARVVLGQSQYDYNTPVDVTVPARTATRIGIRFSEANYAAQLYLPQKVQLIRIQVGGGFLELRDAPVRYCGEDGKSPCGSLQPF